MFSVDNRNREQTVLYLAQQTRLATVWLYPICMVIIALALFCPPPALVAQKALSGELKYFSDFRRSELQQRFDSLVARIGAVIAMSRDGSVGVMENVCWAFKTPLPLLRIILTDEVSEELGLVDSQVALFRHAASEIEEAVEEARLVIGSRRELPANEYRTKVVDRLQEPVVRGFTLIREELLPHQIAALRQAMLVTQIRRIGLCAALTTTPLAETLGIKPDQQQSLQQVLTERARASLQRIHAEHEAAVAEILAVLTQGQRRNLAQILHNQFTFPSLAPTLFRMQLTDAFCTLVPNETESSLIKMLADLERVVFVIQFDSSLTPVLLGDEVLLHEGLAVNIWLTDSEARETLELSDNQVRQLNRLRQDFISNMQQASRELNQTLSEKGERWRKNYLENERATYQKINDNLYSSSHDVLLPFQVEQFERLMYASLFRRLGLVAGIQQAPASVIKLSEGQHASLTKVAEEVHARLQQSAIDEEAQLNMALLDVLTEEQRKHFHDLTLSRLPITTGHLDFHQFFLHPPAAKIINEQHLVLDSFLAHLSDEHPKASSGGTND